jgi:phage repressor protein C with HTH and peptisase S24 domain
METIGERVAAERRAKGWSQARLAEEVTRRGFEIGQSAIGTIESGRVKEPKCIVQLADALGVLATWLQSAKGPKSGAAPQPERDSGAHLQRRPLVSAPEPIVIYRSSSGGSGGGTLILKDPVGLVERPDPLRHSKNAFAFGAVGEDFVPTANPRDVIVVDPDRPIKPGDDVLLVRRDGDPIDGLPRRLVAITPKAWTVRRFHPKVLDEDLPRSEYKLAWFIAAVFRA